MAFFREHAWRCQCGETMSAHLADSINVRRAPELRQLILQGEMHRARCSACGHAMTIEKPFNYVDFDRNAVIRVMPRGERHLWKKASADLDALLAAMPEFVSGSRARRVRVVFGMDELREKLVAQDAGIDDRRLELLKVLLVHEHPVLLRRPRMRLRLEQATDATLEFAVSYEHDPRRFTASMPRATADQLADDDAAEWTKRAHKRSIYDIDDHWVNMWRWSPQPTALERLREYAKQVASGEDIDTKSAQFKRMLTDLPRGTHLPTWAKRDVRMLFDHAQRKGLAELQDQLFELRFDIELEDDWSSNKDERDIESLWNLLKALPDKHVEGNTRIRELKLDEGKDGGLYDPTTYDISIGSNELEADGDFAGVVRHEVGHALHEMSDGLISSWLIQRFGWKVFETDDASIDAWIGLMKQGGYAQLAAQEKREIRAALREALGRGSRWAPGPTPALPAAHPWNARGFGPRLAAQATAKNWYQSHAKWFRADGQAFFLNYYYRVLMVVDEKTLELIDRMPSNYAAMSHFEFFAELYAVHYGSDEAAKAYIPLDVREWIDAQLGPREDGAPRPSRPPVRGREPHEEVVRPS